MEKIIHRANTRGHANHGWLDTHHTFSFANYYDPERIRFGVLRVLNDDSVAAGMGFGTHPHDNMEIVSIPLEGVLEHKDSMGTISVISEGEIQIMSAGTGITHSEYNKSKDRPVKFLQIWVFSDKKNVTPRYGQMKLDSDKMHNQLSVIIAPDTEATDTLWLHQNAWFSIGDFDKKTTVEYRLNNTKNGVYLFVIEGEVETAGEKLSKRDGIGISQVDKIGITTQPHTKILLMEVPMN